MLKLAGSLAALLLVVLGMRALVEVSSPGIGPDVSALSGAAMDPELALLGPEPDSEWAGPERGSARAHRGDAGDVEPAPTTGTGSARGATSRLVGRVLDSLGNPIRQASVQVEGDFFGFDSTVRSSADGRFQIEVPYHAIGTYRVWVSGSEFMTLGRVIVGQQEFAIVPIPWATGRSTDLGDIVLADARVLVGQVVDLLDEGVEKATIRASYRGAVKTGVDGSFRLPHVPVLSDSVKLTAPGFQKRVVEFDAHLSSVHDLGKIELTPRAETPARAATSSGEVCRFRVVDAATGEGLLRYRVELKERLDLSLKGLSVSALPDADALRSQLRSAPEFQMGATPLEDSVTIAAPGYRTREIRIRLDATSGVQVVKLKPAPSVHGRVVMEGQPVPFAEVLFVLGEHLLVRDGSIPQESESETGWRRGARAQPVYPSNGSTPAAMGASVGGWGGGSKRVVYADGEGRFSLHLTKSRQGTVRASHHGDQSRRILFERNRRGDTDLGNLELLPQATLQGVLRFTGGESAGGYKVQLFSSAEEETFTRADGRFEFAGLPQGDVFLRVFGGDTLAFSSGHRTQSFHAIIEGPDPAVIVFQIETQPSALVEVIATVNGLPASDLRLFMSPDGARSSRSVELDEGGRGIKRVPAGTPISISLSGQGLELYLPEKPTFEEGKQTLAVQLSHGSILVRLPEGLVLPKDAHATLKIESPGDRENSIYGTPQRREDGRSEIMFRGVPSGSMNVELEIDQRVQRSGQASILERTFAAVVREGGLFEIEL